MKTHLHLPQSPSNQPQMLVVSDVDDVELPLPPNMLLTRAAESRYSASGLRFW